MARRRFKYACFCVTDLAERDEYVRLMQDIKVDRPEHFEIVSQSSGWTKDGDKMVDVEYIETLAESEERF